jgi:hypothetical protein
MDFLDAKVAMDILKKYSCGQMRDWGDDDNRKIPITGTFEFGHEQCWISLPRASDSPVLLDSELRRLEDAGWFYDEEVGAWSHF